MMYKNKCYHSFKTVICLLLALFTIVFSSLFVYADSVAGDFNGDNRVDLLDIIELKKIISNQTSIISGSDYCAGDLTNLITTVLSGNEIAFERYVEDDSEMGGWTPFS